MTSIFLLILDLFFFIFSPCAICIPFRRGPALLSRRHRSSFIIQHILVLCTNILPSLSVVFYTVSSFMSLFYHYPTTTLSLPLRDKRKTKINFINEHYWTLRFTGLETCPSSWCARPLSFLPIQLRLVITGLDNLFPTLTLRCTANCDHTRNYTLVHVILFFIHFFFFLFFPFFLLLLLFLSDFDSCSFSSHL